MEINAPPINKENTNFAIFGKNHVSPKNCLEHPVSPVVSKKLSCMYNMFKAKLIINYWSNTRVKLIPIFIQRDVRPSSFMCFARWGTILKKKSNDLRKCIMTLTLKEVLLLSPSSLTAGDGGGSIRAVSQVNFSIMINSRWKLCFCRVNSTWGLVFLWKMLSNYKTIRF